MDYLTISDVFPYFVSGVVVGFSLHILFSLFGHTFRKIFEIFFGG